MNAPCSNGITCPGTDSPMGNFSSETEETFYATAMGYCCDGTPISATADSVVYAESLLTTMAAACTPCPTPPVTCDPTDIEEYWIVGEQVRIVIRIACGEMSQETQWQLYEGRLPNGLDITNSPDGSTTIEGTPTETGEFPISVVATDPSGRSRQKRYKLSILDLIPAVLVEGEVGTAYIQYVQAIYGSGNYRYSIVGEVPPGLTLGSVNGLISGTPTLAGVYDSYIQVRDVTARKTQLFYRPITITEHTVDPATCEWATDSVFQNDAALVSWVEVGAGPIDSPANIPYLGTYEMYIDGQTWRMCFFTKRFISGNAPLGNFDIRDAYIGGLWPGTVTAPKQKYCLTVTTTGGQHINYLSDAATYTPIGTYTLDPAVCVHTRTGTAPAHVTIADISP